jgi:hypothetical protein
MKTSRLENLPHGEFKLFSLIAKSLLDSVCSSSESNRNNKEYLAHIVAVLHIIDQKGLPKKCRMLAKAVVIWSEALKNLQEAADY